MTTPTDLQERAINVVRFLSADAVQKANSGHPGMPMGTAAIAYTLWMKHMRFNPKNPDWVNRDRFILSGGHGSMLLYSMLHLTGYDLTLDDLKDFRQWESRTPGHPECFQTEGVEVTTGPLGQGFGNGVGMAIAEANLAATFNRDGLEIIDHHTYVLATDGDLMEGIASEAASIAGHLGLGKLIVLYDDNRISIDGGTDLTFTEDVAARFEAYGWHVQREVDGNSVDAIDKALTEAKSSSKPSLIMCRTNIGFGLPTRQDTSKAHGEPAGEDELAGAKQKLGWPVEPTFHVPDDVREHYQFAIEKGQKFENDWQKTMDDYSQSFPGQTSELKRRLAGSLPNGWDLDLPVFDADDKGIATRGASGKVINALAKHLEEMIGGSADLTGSNKTWIDSSTAMQKDNLVGRNIYFGVREHAMGAIINGLAAHGGFIPYSATFLMFSDYMEPAIRISALSKHRSIWVFTHDSIGLGEDGPTHQPIEQIVTLRAIPDLVVIGPGDANEVVEAWKIAIERNDGPTLMAFTRQKIPILNRKKYSPATGLRKGAYILADCEDGKPDIILMASGSEVDLIVQAGLQLTNDGVKVRLVSFPSWELFEQQGKTYQDSVLPLEVTARLAVEAGISFGWSQWVGPKGKTVSIDQFGASAPAKVLFEKFGFSVDNVVKQAREILENLIG